MKGGGGKTENTLISELLVTSVEDPTTNIAGSVFHIAHARTRGIAAAAATEQGMASEEHRDFLD